MPRSRLLISALMGWLIVVSAALVSRVLTADTRPLAPEYIAWILLAAAPVFTALVMAHGQPSRSVAQILYDTEQDSGRERPADVTRG